MATRPKKQQGQGDVLPTRLATKARSATAASNYDRGNSIPLHQSYLNSRAQDYRYATSPVELLRKMAHTDGMVSTALVAMVQVANSGWKVKACARETGQFDPQGTLMAMSILNTIDTMHDYTKGFSSKRSVATAVSQSLREVALTGALAMELVMDKFQMPHKFQIVPYETLRMVSRGDGDFFPEQRVGGQDPIQLNIPNFFMSELLKDADKNYADSLFEGAANASIYFTEFLEDVRRVLHASGHKRLVAKLNAEKVTAAAKAAGKRTPTEIQTYMQGIIDEVTTMLAAIEPDQAVVTYDALELDEIESSNDKADYTQLIQTIGNLAATALKSSPSVLGMRGQGSQSLSNTESLVFLKNVKSLHVPVEECFSRALTLACRLYGFDVYVEFKFKNINLRPDDELQSFETQRKDGLLKELSLGLISDEEYAWEVGRFPLPATWKPRSGTDFYGLVAPAPAPGTNQDKPKPQEKALEPDDKRAGGEDNGED